MAELMTIDSSTAKWLRDDIKGSFTDALTSDSSARSYLHVLNLESMGKEQAVFRITCPLFLFYSGVVVAKWAIITYR